MVQLRCSGDEYCRSENEQAPVTKNKQRIIQDNWRTHLPHSVEKLGLKHLMRKAMMIVMMIKMIKIIRRLMM